MRITVEITKLELAMEALDESDVKHLIVGGLDEARDYPSYNVYVKIVDEVAL